MREIEAGEPGEEPNCGLCHDSREVWYGPGSWTEPMKLPCPECSPPNPDEPVF